jgi:GTPase SAR1 family protein
MVDKRRILVFGSSNVGKTSMLNMLCDQNKQVSSAAIGCTFETVPFPLLMRNNIEYQFYDTAGLHEADRGTVTTDQALRNILTLLKSSKDGFSLLIFVVRIGSILQTDKLTYEIFVDALTLKKVPVLCVITGCENEDPMNDYAIRNKCHYEEKRMLFTDMVSVCFAKGGPMEKFYKSLREDSRDAVWRMIARYGSPSPITFLDANNSVMEAFKRTWNVFCDWMEIPKWRCAILDEQLGTMLDRLGIKNEDTRNDFIETVRRRNCE